METLGSVRFGVSGNSTDRKYLNMCVEQYKDGRVFKNDTYVFNPEVETGTWGCNGTESSFAFILKILKSNLCKDSLSTVKIAYFLY